MSDAVPKEAESSLVGIQCLMQRPRKVEFLC